MCAAQYTGLARNVQLSWIEPALGLAGPFPGTNGSGLLRPQPGLEPRLREVGASARLPGWPLLHLESPPQEVESRPVLVPVRLLLREDDGLQAQDPHLDASHLHHLRVAEQIG